MPGLPRQLCQQLSGQLQLTHGQCTAGSLAARLGIGVQYAAWQVADGRIVFFAECTRQPLQITLNESAIAQLTKAQVSPDEQRWFTREQIIDVIVAHELFHLLSPAPPPGVSATELEHAAHAFAQTWTGLPFHPTRYEQILWATFSA